MTREATYKPLLQKKEITEANYEEEVKEEQKTYEMIWKITHDEEW